MYKQYLNDYERRAEQIRKAARAVENGGNTIITSAAPISPATQKEKSSQSNLKQSGRQESSGLSGLLSRFAADDILILALLFLLISNEDKDSTLIIILGYLFLSGL